MPVHDPLPKLSEGHLNPEAASTNNGKWTQDGSAMLVSEAGDWGVPAKWPCLEGLNSLHNKNFLVYTVDISIWCFHVHGQISHGPYISKFENTWQNTCDAAFCHYGSETLVTSHNLTTYLKYLVFETGLIDNTWIGRCSVDGWLMLGWCWVLVTYWIFDIGHGKHYCTTWDVQNLR